MLITQAKEKCLASCKGINLDFLNKLYLAPLRILSMSWFVPSLNVRKVCNTPPLPPPLKKKNIQKVLNHIFMRFMYFFFESTINWLEKHLVLNLPLWLNTFRISHPEVFLGKRALKIFNKLEITLLHGCSPVNLLHIFRKPFPKNT